MESLSSELEQMADNANLSKSIQEVQACIDMLSDVRSKVATDPKAAALSLAMLNNDIDKPFKSINKELKVVNTGLNKYSKALDKKFKDKPLPTSEYDALSSRSALIDRAIAMHLLREGQFSVASAFVQDANESASKDEMDVGLSGQISLPDPKLGVESVTSEELRKQFASMHNVLEELKKKNLLPAIGWARANSKALEKRGSNLEFELGKLQFIHLFLGGSSHNDPQNKWEGQQRALEYARQEFGPFQHRYLREIQQLIGAMAFSPNLKQSPYRRIFCNDDAWDELGNTFMREFCSLLGLSAESPLYIAATAGAIALPTLLKLQTIMKERRTEWTTQHELPVEIPLPPAYQYHSIFVCPISKEQATDENPPMMMPCGHVIARESLSRHAKGSRFKCPYCPNESHPREAREIII